MLGPLGSTTQYMAPSRREGTLQHAARAYNLRRNDGLAQQLVSMLHRAQWELQEARSAAANTTDDMRQALAADGGAGILVGKISVW